MDASCKGVPGCIQCSLGHLVAKYVRPNWSCYITVAPWSRGLDEQKVNLINFIQGMLEASCKGVPGCILCSLGHLVAKHVRPNWTSYITVAPWSMGLGECWLS